MITCVCVCALAHTRTYSVMSDYLRLHGPIRFPLSMGFSRQEYWSGLPCAPQGIFPTQGLKPPILHLLHWVLVNSVCGETSFLVHRLPYSLCILACQRGLSEVCKRALIPFLRAPSSWANHLPWMSPPNTITLGVRMSHMNLWGERT